MLCNQVLMMMLCVFVLISIGSWEIKFQDEIPTGRIGGMMMSFDNENIYANFDDEDDNRTCQTWRATRDRR